MRDSYKAPLFVLAAMAMAFSSIAVPVLSELKKGVLAFVVSLVAVAAVIIVTKLEPYFFKQTGLK